MRVIQQQIYELNQAEAVDEETKVAERIKSNPKAFYAHANKFRKTKAKIGPLKTDVNGTPEYTAGPQKMAEILSSQYESVFSTPSTRNIPAADNFFEPLTDIIIKVR